MKPACLIIICLFCFLSCQHRPTSSNKKIIILSKAQININKLDTSSTVPDTTKKLLSFNIDHFFSDTLTKDNFNITLYGKGVLKGIIIFKIYNYKHQQIFKDVFPATDLLYDELDVLNIKQQKDTITSRMATFLNNRYFTSPAINNAEKFDEDFEDPDSADRNNWEIIKADHTSVGFVYNHGYEGTYGIAYSKNKRKVVSIFYSD